MKFSLYKHNIFPILFSLSFYSCSIEPDLDKLPIIQPSFGFSIFREAVTLNDVDIFTEDSSITKESFGTNDSIFVFNKTINIDKQEVGDKLSIDDINKQFSQNIDNISIEDTQVEERVGFDPVGIEPVVESISSVVGTISLGNITPQNTEPYLLSTIFPGVSAFPDGSTQNVPSFDLAPATNNFSFNDFSSAVFSAGILSLSIVNDLVIPLGDINIQLQNSDGVNISGASTLISGPINPATTATGNLDLSGITLPGSIIIEVTGSSPGGDNILINDASINSSFSVQISGSGLEVTSATAKIPEQIISESGEIAMASDSNKVVLATISQGNLVIEIDNYMALGSEMSLTIPSLKTSAGNDFQTSISISGNTADIIDQTDISGYSLSMDIDDQAVVYTYEILTVDTENELISIEDTDSIIVNIQLEGSSDGEDISFSNFEGLVTPQNIGFNGEMAIDSDSDILEASLNSGSLIININNPINGSVSGVPSAMITISELVSITDDQALTIDTGPMSGQMDPISVDLDNYKLILPQADQNLYYVADVQTAYEVARIGIRQSDLMAEVVAAQIRGTEDYGGDLPALHPLILAGESASTAHPMWTDEKLGDGQTVAFELGGCRKRYNVGLARTIHLGKKKPTKLIETGEVVKEGMSAVKDSLFANVKTGDIHKVWQKILDRYGLEKKSRIGYSIGAAYAPDWGEHTLSFRPNETALVPENAVVHIILGMWMDGWGMELSETLHVTESGCTKMTDFPQHVHLVQP